MERIYKGYGEKLNQIIEQGLDILDRRIQRAKLQEDILDAVINEVSKSNELTQDSLKALKGLKLESTKDLASFLASLIGKDSALVSSECSKDILVKLIVPEGAEEYAE